MNFTLNHEYSDGNTSILREEAEQLIPRISTMGELNALNILRAREWAFDNRTMKSMDPLEESYVGELRHRMLDGSVRKSGDRVRIAARLVRADNGYVVWSETYDRPFNDILMVQSGIADEVTKALRASIGSQTGP